MLNKIQNTTFINLKKTKPILTCLFPITLVAFLRRFDGWFTLLAQIVLHLPTLVLLNIAYLIVWWVVFRRTQLPTRKLQYLLWIISLYKYKEAHLQH